MSFDGQNIRHFPIGLVYVLEIPAIKCSASKSLGIKGFGKEGFVWGREFTV
jgi:hypothetical protein